MTRLLLSALLFFATSPAWAVSINGAGSTFAEPVYTRWFADFQKKALDARFNYQGIGSGAGIKQLLEGTVDFAGTDDPMKPTEIAKAKSNVLHVPIAMGAVVVTYNLPEVKETLKLSGETVAKIFNGTISNWNDEAIAKTNPGLKLPNLSIAVATRSDGSGTTAVFTEYLSKVSPAWQRKNGKTVQWFPASLGAKGNAGVAGLVKQNVGTIGYVELIYAVENKLPFAAIENKSREFVAPSVKSVSAAAQGVKKDAVAQEFKVSITDSKEKGAYPISAFTWMLVYDKMPKQKGEPILKFAKWTMTDEAQDSAARINFAPVPKDLRAEVLKALDKVKLE
jgi:phosphate transport system substrate-binding protein